MLQVRRERVVGAEILEVTGEWGGVESQMMKGLEGHCEELRELDKGYCSFYRVKI